MRAILMIAAVASLSACVRVPSEEDKHKDPRVERQVVAVGTYKQCDGNRAVYVTNIGRGSSVAVVENAPECKKEETK